jgi:hypothetical protein
MYIWCTTWYVQNCPIAYLHPAMVMSTSEQWPKGFTTLHSYLNNAMTCYLATHSKCHTLTLLSIFYCGLFSSNLAPITIHYIALCMKLCMTVMWYGDDVSVIDNGMLFHFPCQTVFVTSGTKWGMPRCVWCTMAWMCMNRDIDQRKGEFECV